MEKEVKENSSAIMEHAAAIRTAADASAALGKKFDGAVKEVQKQGQKSLTQFETLKALIESQWK